MKNTIETIPISQCTGCGACAALCPEHAISMKEDAEGFLSPVILAERCVSCGKCLRACPVRQPAKKHEGPDIYAAWAKNDVRKISSSGGVFTVLAHWILEQGGHVCGAAYSEDWSQVRHTWAHSEAQLDPLRGSKYVQSDVGDTYRQALEYLNRDEWVLYTGCPCQIAGLYSAVGGDHPKLLTVDIVCHGTPSPLAYRSFLKEIAKGTEIDHVDFREKAFWGWGSATSIFLKNGEVYRADFQNDPYFNAFLKGLLPRKSCFSCPYTSMTRIGDFTLGDFWGVGEINPSWDDNHGTGIVFINSEKARPVFEQLKPSFPLLERATEDQYRPIAGRRNGRLLWPPEMHPSRALFYMILPVEGFHAAYNKTMLNGFDVGLVGWWSSSNYGSALTAFALNRTLQAMGKSVLMLPDPGMTDTEEARAENGMRFASSVYFPLLRNGEEHPRHYNSCCDIFVVGSDQLWNWWCIKDVGYLFYYLDFANPERRKISYATSFGVDWSDHPNDMRLKIGYYMSRFDFLSVRENSAVDLCREKYGLTATQVLDPVFLCGQDAFDEVLRLSERQETEPYVFSYILDPSEDKINAAFYLSRKLGLPLRILTEGQEALQNNLNMLNDIDGFEVGASIPDWLYLLCHSSYVITDSYHGFCLSLIFKKQVYGFMNEVRGNARFMTIAGITGLHDRLVQNYVDFEARINTLPEIDFDSVAKRLEPEIQRSRAWLKNALDCQKPETSVRELQLWKTIEHDRDIYNYRIEIQQLKDQVAVLTKQLHALQEASSQSSARQSSAATAEKAADPFKQGVKSLFKKLQKK